MNNPVEHFIDVDDVHLCYFEWGDPAAEPLLLVHATGFHARCWDQVVRALKGTYRVIALDMRGHGRSDKIPPYNWARFGADLVGFVDALALHGAIAVGHSMGGHCVVQAAAARPAAFSRLVLVDPVILDPALYQQRSKHTFERVEDHPVARRRNRFPSWQAMRDQLQSRGSYGLWEPAVLEDYCRYGLLPVAAGEDLELACPPLVEASVYFNNTSSDVHERLAGIRQPVLVLRAPPRDPADQTMDFSKSPTWPALASEFPHARDVLLAQLTHFIPMQDPALTADFIEHPERPVP